MKKRGFLSAVLAVVMTVSMLTCFALPAAAATSGTTGDCTWSLDGTVLTISGTGAMGGYDYHNPAPWGTEITEVIVENGVTSIGDSAFEECTGLTSVTIPDSVTTIGYAAFCACDSLTAVTIPNSVTAIKEFAFSNCTSLASVKLSERVTTIGNSAFAYCDSLTAVTIPDSVTTIGGWAFYSCNNLASVTIPNGVTFIGDSAFSDCDSLLAVTLPESITTICPYVFAYCDNLASVTIPDSVKTIDVSAFYSCEGLTSITIPDSVITIGKSAFEKCTGLTSVKLSDNVTTIGAYAFYSCNNLASVTIPGSVTSIGRDAFGGCDNLKIATIYNPDIILEDGAFPTATEVIYKESIDTSVPHLKLDPENTNLALLNTAGLAVTRVYWGYTGTEAIETQNWNTFAAAVPSAIRVNDYNPTEGEVYAMEKSGYYLFWIQYTDSEGVTQNICHTVYAEGALDENYGKPYLAFDESGKVAWMNLNGTTVQKMYWGYIGDTDYKYINWDEFCTRVRGNGSYLPDYGVKDGEGYVVNEEGYYRFVIVYLDAQGIRQERYFTIKAETPATAPSMDNSTLSNVATFINQEGYTAKTYYGYIGEENTKYVDFNDFKATATDFTTDFGTPAGKTFKLTKAGYWRFVINYTVNGATKDAICTVYVDEADLALGTPKLIQSGSNITLDYNGSAVTKMYVGYMGTDAVEIDSWADYIDNRQSNSTYYGPKDGTSFTLGNRTGYYTVVVSYNTGGADQLAFYTFNI